MLRANRKSNINTNMLLFNGAGVMTGLIVVGYTISSFFHTETVPTCATRYNKALVFGLETNAGPMSSIELQSRAGQREWGVLENAKVVRVSGAPAPAVVEVQLERAKTSPVVDGLPLSGIGMSWVPPGFTNIDAACLSYSVWVPEDFDFGRRGALPGLYGGNRPEANPVQNDPKRGFLAHVAWGLGGEGQPHGLFLNAPDPRGGALGGTFSLVRGAWSRLDQEVVLNKGEAPDGLYRLWVNGKLVVDNPGVQWRKDDKLHLTGVAGDVLYVPDATKKGSTMLRFSPPVVGWR